MYLKVYVVQTRNRSYTDDTGPFDRRIDYVIYNTTADLFY